MTSSSTPPAAEEYYQVEIKVLQRAQKQSFPEDYKLLVAGKSVSPSSCLLTLAPVLDQTSVLSLGGRLR